MGVSKNNGCSPQIIHSNRVFHYFHHPFWGYIPLFLDTSTSPTFCVIFRRVGNLFRSPKERGHTDVPKRHGDHGAGDQVAGG